MDSQGTPIGGSHTGQKVTTDPRSKQPINESTGAIASDSLAAESYNQGGGFASNRDARPNGVSGSSSTWNNTDTSGANTLDAAPDAPRRQDDDKAGGKYPEALGGQGQFPGVHSDGSGGYVGGPSGNSTGTSAGDGNSSLSTSAADTTGSVSASGADSYGGSNAGVAPNYALNPQGAFKHSKPKGDNLTEGGFEGEGTNYASDIGTQDDPGRQAVLEFASTNAAATGPSAYGKVGGSSEQPFDALRNDESA